MADSIFHIRLREARKMRGWSMEELSEATNRKVTKQSISKYEKGVMEPRLDSLAVLAKALDISLGYFRGETIRLNEPMLRAAFREPLPYDDVQRLESMLAFWVEQYIDAEKKIGMDMHFVNPICELQVCTIEQASEAANRLRMAWHCGDGPIPSILRLMERKGIKILDRQLPAGVLGLSTCANGLYPLVAIDMSHDKHTVERLRFTAAHELGHIVLNIPAGTETKAVEKLCNQFASFFILPEQTFYEEFGKSHRDVLSLDEMIDVGNVYGMSVQALVHEFINLGIIDDTLYQWWYNNPIEANRKEVGWVKYLFPETIGRERRIKSIY